jgi:aspartate/methionine/tyrosine aminotransferase
VPPEGTFYVFGSVADLPAGMNDGHSFFRAALEHRVIVVPGEFFDVNPGKRRAHRLSRFRHHVRFSFGPSEESITRALVRLEKMVKGA